MGLVLDRLEQTMLAKFDAEMLEITADLTDPSRFLRFDRIHALSPLEAIDSLNADQLFAAFKEAMAEMPDLEREDIEHSRARDHEEFYRLTVTQALDRRMDRARPESQARSSLRQPASV